MDAFAAIYDQMAPFVYSLSIRLTEGIEQAELATESAFLAVWRAARQYDPDRTSAVRWVLETSYSAVVDQTQSSGRTAQPDAAVVLAMLIGAADSAVPVFPTTQLHVAAAVDFALRG